MKLKEEFRISSLYNPRNSSYGLLERKTGAVSGCTTIKLVIHNKYHSAIVEKKFRNFYDDVKVQLEKNKFILVNKK